MDEWLEVEDKTVQEALTQALIKLQLTSDQVEYEVVEEEKGGLLGLFSKPAKIRVRKKGEGSAASGVSGVTASASGSADGSSSADSSTGSAASAASTESTAKTDSAVTGTSGQGDGSASGAGDASESRPAEPRKRREVTRDISTITVLPFLNDIFKAMDLDVSVSEQYNAEEQQIEVELSGSQMGMMIGKRGQTLDALQYLTSLVLNKDHDDYVKVKIDTENYRERRKQTIENLAKNVAKKVKASGRPSTLEPMNPYERRIIHAALQDDKYVKTHSEGDEPHRKVVVTVNPEFADELREKNRSQRDRRRGGYGGRGGNRRPYRGGGSRKPYSGNRNNDGE